MNRPKNMEEVARKLRHDFALGIDETQEDIITVTLLEEIQDMLDGDLEGHYWTAKWKEKDKCVTVLDVLGEPIDTITPQADSFSADFRADAPKLFRNLDTQVKRVVASH